MHARMSEPSLSPANATFYKCAEARFPRHNLGKKTGPRTINGFLNRDRKDAWFKRSRLFYLKVQISLFIIWKVVATYNTCLYKLKQYLKTNSNVKSRNYLYFICRLPLSFLLENLTRIYIPASAGNSIKESTSSIRSCPLPSFFHLKSQNTFFQLCIYWRLSFP